MLPNALSEHFDTWICGLRRRLLQRHREREIPGGTGLEAIPCGTPFVCRVVKELMRLHTHSISGALRAVRDTESGQQKPVGSVRTGCPPT